MPLPIMEAIRQNRLNTVNNPAEYRAEHGGDDPELASLDAFFGKTHAPSALKAKWLGDHANC